MELYKVEEMTPEKMEEMRIENQKKADEMPEDFKIGALVGELCWATKMPTLENGLRSGKVISLDWNDPIVINAKNAEYRLNKNKHNFKKKISLETFAYYRSLDVYLKSPELTKYLVYFASITYNSFSDRNFLSGCHFKLNDSLCLIQNIYPLSSNGFT